MAANTESGTHDFFKQAVLYNGDFKDDVKEQPGSAEVVTMVASDKYAIGYSGIGYKTDGVRAVPLAVSAGRTCYDTSPAATYSNDYPLARYLYIYLNKKQDQPLDPLAVEFVKYVVSKDGQTRTLQGGFYPITKEDRVKDLQLLGFPLRQIEHPLFHAAQNETRRQPWLTTRSSMCSSCAPAIPPARSSRNVS